MSRPMSYMFPARRTQWIVSALAYAYGVDHGAENEVVVLATGVDQYIQQLFHNLDHKNKDAISNDDFCVLCDVLRIVDPTVVNNIPVEMNFKEFHSRLIQYFMSISQTSGFSQPDHIWKQNSELLDIEIDMPDRKGINVHTVCSECYQAKPLSEIYQSLLYKHGHDHTDEKSHIHRIAKSNIKNIADKNCREQCNSLQLQNDALRELVEDMRLALQTSDTRTIALHVALMKLRRDGNQTAVPAVQTTGTTIYRGNTLSRLPVYQELDHMRLARDKQVEEAIIYSQEVASDLVRARREQEAAEQSTQVMLTSQRTMRQQLHTARDALQMALQQVRNSEQKLNKEVSSISVQTDNDITSTCSPPSISPHDLNERLSTPGCSHEETSKLDRMALSPHSDELPMERSVEGKADSDEESLKEWWSLNTSGLDRELTSEEMKDRLKKVAEEKKKIETNFKQMETDLLTELDRRLQEMETTNQELQNFETERVRQSIIEHTLLEIIQLLRRIRKLGLARRLVGKMILETIDMCPPSEPSDTEEDVRNFLHYLHKQLKKTQPIPEMTTMEAVTTSPAQVLTVRKVVKHNVTSTMYNTTPPKAVQIHTNFYTFSPTKQRSVQA